MTKIISPWHNVQFYLVVGFALVLVVSIPFLLVWASAVRSADGFCITALSNGRQYYVRQYRPFRGGIAFDFSGSYYQLRDSVEIKNGACP